MEKIEKAVEIEVKHWNGGRPHYITAINILALIPWAFHDLDDGSHENLSIKISNSVMFIISEM